MLLKRREEQVANSLLFPGTRPFPVPLTAGVGSSSASPSPPPPHERGSHAAAAMSSGWKKAKLGEIPRLLASALGSRARRGVGDSALVIQAGFPTSVADLVVKNRGRLQKKAPRWLRRHRPGAAEAEAEAGCSTMASLASQILATAAPADTAPTLESVLRWVETEREEEPAQGASVAAGVETGRGAISAEGLQSSFREDGARESERTASEASTRPEPEKDALQARNSWRFWMPSKVVFLVFALAIGTQKIALGASISAFAILFLESMGRHLIRSRQSCKGTTKKSSSTFAGVVSVPSSNRRTPVKNLAVLCGRSVEFQAPVEVMAPVPALKPKGHVQAEGSLRDEKASNNGKKAKKLLKKIVTGKLRGPKREKGANAEAASDCSSKGASHHSGEGEHLLDEEEDGGAGGDGNKDEEAELGGLLGFVVAAVSQDVGLKGAAFPGEKNVGVQAKGRSGHLVFFLIILSGLVGGRVAAMVLTILWCLLVSSARSLWKCWKMQQSH